ncbi:hypothetical protein BKA64DRAFT_707542 [Cadophora sp. MPI-SDFR-AT-0126]|nr:hypothetical protein BKA64DRAFT_707542 [Leotiomycetes sp. MPI-SDFR-AT-0126]
MSAVPDDSNLEKAHDDFSKSEECSKGQEKVAMVNDANAGSEKIKAASTTKAERHRRKKENAKKVKAEARLKEEEESRLLDEMSALAVKGMAEEEARKLAANMRPRTRLDDVSAVDESLPFIPPGLLFKFDHSPGERDIGSFATQDIEKDTEILVEEAIMKGTSEHICKEALFSVLSEDKKKRIMALHSLCSCKVKPCTETPLAHVLEVNSYGASSGPALYELAARFNHDCLPNIARGFSKEGFMVLRAARDIKQGEELTVNYAMIPGSTKTRQGYLLEKFEFLCKCHGCKNKLVYTESEIAKAKLPEGVEPKSPVIGRYTSEEVAAYAEVEAWFDNVKEGMVTIQRAQYDYMAKQVVAGNPRVLDRKERCVLAETRNTENMAKATESNFGLIMEDLEEPK